MKTDLINKKKNYYHLDIKETTGKIARKAICKYFRLQGKTDYCHDIKKITNLIARNVAHEFFRCLEYEDLIY